MPYGIRRAERQAKKQATIARRQAAGLALKPRHQQRIDTLPQQQYTDNMPSGMTTQPHMVESAQTPPPEGYSYDNNGNLIATQQPPQYNTMEYNFTPEQSQQMPQFSDFLQAMQPAQQFGQGQQSGYPQPTPQDRSNLANQAMDTMGAGQAYPQRQLSNLGY